MTQPLLWQTQDHQCIQRDLLYNVINFVLLQKFNRVYILPCSSPCNKPKHKLHVSLNGTSLLLANVEIKLPYSNLANL